MTLYCIYIVFHSIQQINCNKFSTCKFEYELANFFLAILKYLPVESHVLLQEVATSTSEFSRDDIFLACTPDELELTTPFEPLSDWRIKSPDHGGFVFHLVLAVCPRVLCLLPELSRDL